MNEAGAMKDGGEGARTRRGWRPDWRRAAVELAVIFMGVTAAFFVESYREDLEEAEDLRRASVGILEELRAFSTRGKGYVDSFRAPIAEWRRADEEGRRSVPEFYRIPGAPNPPTEAWEATVASGVASQFEPEFRYDLGYFYSEFHGIHVNYLRHLVWIENHVLPRAELGPDAFYDEQGRFDPAVRSRIRLVEEYVDDLERLSTMAGGLAEELERRMAEW